MLTGMLMASTLLCAQEDGRPDDTARVAEMPQIRLILQRDRLLSRVPGSVAFIDPATIRRIAPVTANELLRKVPGLNITDEEGAGLRINVGIRGMDPDRSRNVLMLEDGIPLALNPYGEPEMYFTPSIDKITSVEVLKGSGQILFGPQTTGGVINLITAQPPEKRSTLFRFKAGSGGLTSTYASHGNTVGNTGYIVNYLHKRADNIGPTRFSLHDLSAKFRIELDKRSFIGVKLGFYDEGSNSTYIGLTQTMYDKGGQDFVRMAPSDRLLVRRYSLSATHQFNINSALQLHTTLFGHHISRDWRRQDFTTSPTASGRTGVVWGDPSVPGGAIHMLKTNGQRNRSFDVAGLESQIRWRTSIHQLQAGARLLSEQADEQFVIGSKPDATGGDLRDVELRKGLATSLYALDRVTLTDRLDIHFGVRFEYFDYARNILRGRFNVNGQTIVADTNVTASGHVAALIPGFGFNFRPVGDIVLFGGIHRGFAPPRTKDAITSTGMPLDIRQEDSWNSELGMRHDLNGYLISELTFFRMDFKNQIIPVSQSSGNANATGLANGGSTRHLGMEGAISFDIGRMLQKNYALTLASNVTIVDSRFASDRYIPAAGAAKNVRGNKLPYAPGLMFNNSISFEAKSGTGFRWSGNYVGEQFADELNSVRPSPDGRTGLLPSRYVMDLTLFSAWTKKSVFFTCTVKNLLDERYIASRRPQGIRVGLGRQIIFGVEMRLK